MIRIRHYLRLLPFVIAVVSLVIISQHYAYTDILADIQRESTILLIPLALGISFVRWWLMAIAEYWTLCSFAKPRFFDVMFAKAACYVFEIVNFAVGRGGYAIWINRRYQISGSLAFGMIVYITAIELGASTFIVSAVYLFESIEPVIIGQLAIATCLTLTTLIILSPWKPLGEPVQFFYPWTRQLRRKSFALLGLKIVQKVVFITTSGMAAQLFGLEVPWPVIFTYFPVIFVVAVLPVNVAGFGAVQGAWLLLEPWADGERILAFSITWGLLLTAAAILRGLPFINRVTGDFVQATPAAD